jgi:DNA-binding CsgD family transcriptional regulator
MKRRGRPPYPDLLTPREQQVLDLLRQHLSNEQIAERLGISLSGAKYHVSEILSKLGVSSREEASRWQPEGRPWWLAAFVPFDALRRRLGWAPSALAGTVGIAALGGFALIIWGIMQTEGTGRANALCQPSGEVGNFFVDVTGTSFSDAEAVADGSIQGLASSTLGRPTGQTITVLVDDGTEWHGPVQEIRQVPIGISLQASGPWRDDCRMHAANVFSASNALDPTPPLAPLPTRTPFVAQPVDCPGGFSTPEGAIAACLQIRRPGTPYEEDCDVPLAGVPAVAGNFTACSVWVDGVDQRAYQITNIGADAGDWAIVERQSDGWRSTMWTGCAVQRQIDADLLVSQHGLDLSEIRIDDCRMPPLPITRPILRVGTDDAPVWADNGRTQLGVTGALLYRERGIKLSVLVYNSSGQTLPWTADDPASIVLISEDGAEYPASQVGGTLARTVAEGIPPDAYWSGWAVFPAHETGAYVLRYPGQPDVSLDLSPRNCLVFCDDPKD